MAFGGLYTSISGLQASKISLNTVGHNISNANNANYVRQSAIHTNTSYKKLGGTSIEQGTGVKVIQIRQIRDEFLDKQIRRELPSFGYFYAKAQTLEDVENVFNEITNSGLQNIMKDFWRGWDELSKEPDSLVNREIVHESAVAFTNTVNHISSQLSDIQINLNKEILSKVDEANSLIMGIAKLNKTVKLVEGEKNKMRANDIRDERNAMIDRLSELLPVETYENSLGETTISLKGQDLVNGSFVSKIEIRPDSKDGEENNGFGHVFWQNSSERIDLGQKGEIAGTIDVRDKSVVEYKERLDILVGEMADEINALHQTGYGLGQKPGDVDYEGIDFFEGGGGKITAANIKVNSLLSNLNLIAASASGEIGDSEVAQEILKIRDNFKIDKFDDDTKQLTIDGFYNDLVTSLALEREAARSNAENQGFLIMSIDEKRTGLSSVSLDEEMADMIKFQHAYSANSRVINALDEMIDTIVNRLGIVGR